MDDEDQSPLERLVDIAFRAVPYLLIGTLIGRVVAAFAEGSAYEPVVARVAVCVALAIVTGLAIDQAVIRLQLRHLDHGDTPTS